MSKITTAEVPTSAQYPVHGNADLRILHRVDTLDCFPRMGVLTAPVRLARGDDVPQRGVGGVGPRVFRRQLGPVMFRVLPRA